MSRVDTMLKWARKKMQQRNGRLLAKHGNETFNGEPMPRTAPLALGPVVAIPEPRTQNIG